MFVYQNKGEPMKALLHKKNRYCEELPSVLDSYAGRSQVSAQHATGQIAFVQANQQEGRTG